jgi:hypothetical protein
LKGAGRISSFTTLETISSYPVLATTCVNLEPGMAKSGRRRVFKEGLTSMSPATSYHPPSMFSCLPPGSPVQRPLSSPASTTPAGTAPHTPAWRASEPVAGAAGGGRGGGPVSLPGERFAGWSPRPPTSRPIRSPPAPGITLCRGLRCDRPPPPLPRPPTPPQPKPGRAPPPRPPAFPARPAPTFTCTFCTRGGSSGEKHLPGTATSPARLRPASSFPSKAAK